MVPYRNADAWQRLAAAVGRPAALSGDSADISELSAARAFMERAADRLGGIAGVAALAGGYRGSGPLDAAPEAEWDDMLRINLQTAYVTCRAALPFLLVSRGSVVTVGSRSAEAGGAGAASYAVSKMAILALTRALALENRERGIRFNAVSPLTIDTEANRMAMPKADRARWTPPEQIARVVAFLLSPASAAISGAVIPV
jgi:NAD(P)-dependent dehydrogenase (short-subunit alcohol dehydrogenase family)